jgi:hypothetical protein
MAVSLEVLQVLLLMSHRKYRRECGEKKCTCFDLLLGRYNVSHIYALQPERRQGIRARFSRKFNLAQMSPTYLF